MRGHKAARSDLEDHLKGNATCAWASVLENDAKAVWISGGSGGHRGVSNRDRCVESVALDVIAITAREATPEEECGTWRRSRATRRSAIANGPARSCGKPRASGRAEPRRRPDGHRAVGCFARELWDDLREAPAGGARACCAGAALLASASAQRCAIASALAQNKLPDSLAAKLCGGVAEKLEAARNASRDGAPKHHARLDRAAANSAAADANLFRGLRAYFCAREAKAKEEHGVCVAWYRDAGAIGAGDRLHLGRGRRPAPRPRRVEEGPTSGARGRGPRELRITTRRCRRRKNASTPAVKTMGPEAPLC